MSDKLCGLGRVCVRKESYGWAASSELIAVDFVIRRHCQMAGLGRILVARLGKMIESSSRHLLAFFHLPPIINPP